MISKEKFIDYMTRYKELEDNEYKVDKILKLLGKDLNGFYLEHHHILMLEMLRDLVNDKNDCILYFIYECNWGKDKKDIIINNISYSLTNCEELYEIIKSNN